MALDCSGTLHLKGSAVYPNQSIVHECTDAYTAYNLLAARAVAGFDFPVSMQDFYCYAGCSLPVPGIPGSCAGSCNGYTTTVTYTAGTNATKYYLQYAPSPYTSWSPPAPGAWDSNDDFSWTVSNPPGSYKGRVLSDNCAGQSAYRTSAIFSC